MMRDNGMLCILYKVESMITQCKRRGRGSKVGKMIRVLVYTLLVHLSHRQLQKKSGPSHKARHFIILTKTDFLHFSRQRQVIILSLPHCRAITPWALSS